MKGRIVMLRLMPDLNLLVANGVVTPSVLQTLVQENMQRMDMDPGELITQLYGLEIPEDKFEVFSDIMKILEVKIDHIKGGIANV